MITRDKVIELFCMADDFCKFFDRIRQFGIIKLSKKLVI